LAKKVAVSELSADAIRQLMALSKEVYFPLLTNPGNQEGWPEVIAKELTENLHRFLAQTFVTMGHMNGETLLPLPPDDVYSMEKNQHDKDSVHVLETAVIAWTRQIKDILRLVGLCSQNAASVRYRSIFNMFLLSMTSADRY
jgi:dynein heavy chain